MQYDKNKVGFHPRYTWWKTKGKHLVDEYNIIKKSTTPCPKQKTSMFLNCCDCYREESNIFYSIYYMTSARNKTIKRLWIDSLEVDEVRKGFNNLQDNKKTYFFIMKLKHDKLVTGLLE